MNLGILALTLPLMTGTLPEQPIAPPVPAAFTFVKVLGPSGSKTTWYPGTHLAVAQAFGKSVALRPGYLYRFELANVGQRRDAVIWPSIEVRGSLVHRPNMNVADHPIPIILSEDEVERILEGRFLTKFYYLEDPDQATNGPQPPGVPVESTAANEEDAIKEARARGRLMIIVRAGERLWTPEELVRENVPGTIWVPGTMRAIPVPVAPPCFPFAGISLYDPLYGQKTLKGECLYDGGDRNLNLGIGRENKLYGLDPADTSLEFTTPSGKKVVSSNRVCICIPRFAVERVEVAAIAQHQFRGPQIGVHTDRQTTVIHRMPSLAVERIEQPLNAIAGLRASGLVLDTGPLAREVFIGKPVAVANLKGAQVTAQVRETEDLTVYPDCSLILVKRMSPPHPKQIGDVVTFHLLYRNPGAQMMTNLIVSDSLTGRLEYIEGSAKSDRAATFTATPNEAGSVVLRWSIDGALPAGHSGEVSFQARVR